MRILILALTLCATAGAASAQTSSAPDTKADWVRQPTSAEMQAVWPRQALAEKKGGRAVIGCEVTPQGALAACKVIEEEPTGMGFGDAGLRLAPSFALKPATQAGRPVGSTVQIPITFQPQAEALDVNPDWIRKPTYEELQAVLPRDALRKGRGGKVVLSCILTARALLEACIIASEDPPDMGFGTAALLLTPSFVFKPGMKDGKPVQTTVNLPIQFQTPRAASPSEIRKAPMVTEPVWDRAPSFADMAAAWPKGADAEFGHVSMRCKFTQTGFLRHCEVLTENPRGQGFGTAARNVVATHFQLRVTPEVAQEVAKASVNVPVRFTKPDAKPETSRTIVEPKWITRVDPEKVVKVFPDAAVRAGVTQGRGVAECLVGADGKLTNCKPASATPENLGFAEAAVEVASVMVMNPWSDGGGPVDGVRIRLPVTFNLAPGQETAATKP